jgi:hypothetical protein
MSAAPLGDSNGEGGAASRIVNGKRTRRRYAHRGWSIDNSSLHKNMKCFPGGFIKKSVKGFPYPLVWPTYNDVEGAASLIDAVLGGDLDALYDMKAQYPTHIFGFEEWMENPEQSKLKRKPKWLERTLRVIPLPRGFEMRINVVIVSKTQFQLQAVIATGETIMARRPLMTRDIPPDLAVPPTTQPLPEKIQ